MFHRINCVDQDGEVTGGFLIPGEVPIEYVRKLVAELKCRSEEEYEVENE